MENIPEPVVSKYSKRQLLKSNRYHGRRDLLNALLEDERQYSHAEVAAIIEKFMKRKPKKSV